MSPTSISDLQRLARPSARMAELARPECLRLLAEHDFGRLAVALGDGPPAIRPVNYAFDERSQSVIIRTARGSKFSALINSASASFEIDEIDPQTRTGWSVIIQGVSEAITDESEIVRIGELGLDPWAPGFKGDWVRVRAFTVSGRLIARPAE
jgi:nitroimidazol reductase NimA-like FMN-containing flavoprotein (pyridoxamine 5'-phosphate oxidase superfamily)